MRLALSTAAAPDFTLDELLAACRRRGLAGLELVAGHGHGVSAALEAAELEEIRQRCEASGAPVVAFRVAWDEALGEDAVRLSAALRAPVIAVGSEGDAAPEPALAGAAAAFARAGGALLIAHGTDPDAVRRLRRVVDRAPVGALGLAWEVDPGAEDITGRIAETLEAAGPHLWHVRLRGGGPESVQHEGRGIGPLMSHLALAGYSGALALAPSTPRYRVVWRTWLGRGGGWGCGSKVADRPLVQVNHTQV